MSLSLVAVPIPGIAQPIQSMFMTIIYLDFLMTDKWLTPMLEMTLTQDEQEDNEAINTYFDGQGFSSKFLLFNIGSTLIFMAMQIFLLLLTGIAALFKPISSWAKRLHTFLSSRLIWGGTIRFIIQQFQPLLMSSLINIASYSLADLEDKSLGVLFSYTLSVLIISVLGISVVSFIKLTARGRVNEPPFAPLIDGIKSPSSRPLSPYWTSLTLLKWSAMCLSLVLLTNHPAQQLQSLTALSILTTALQLHAMPQLSRIEEYMGLFNEVMGTLYLYGLVGITLVEGEGAREIMGFVLLGIMLGTFMANVGKIVVMAGVFVGKKYKAYRVRKEREQDKVINLRTEQYQLQQQQQQEETPEMVAEEPVAQDVPHKKKKLVWKKRKRASKGSTLGGVKNLTFGQPMALQGLV
ncbi:hypothetical protein FGO68_gene14693 [Halteria grandinella]|uniref:TRP C-terminal domain-containing protein n=1 Tax=Halteria grandinella TaxID=5974 RepID=A0A8J8NCS2_HALGN|nr:hypothetical protein FGO68_gene14693 [Halteria grandinella]